MPSPARSRLAAPCKVQTIGGGPEITFKARSVSGGGDRSLAEYSGLGEDGGDLEDMGEPARIETVVAELHEDEYQLLERIKRNKKKLYITHPLFGSFNGRIAGIQYSADHRDMVDVTVRFKEDGIHASTLAAPIKRPSVDAQRKRVKNTVDTGPTNTAAGTGSPADSPLYEVPDDFMTEVWQSADMEDIWTIYVTTLEDWDEGNVSPTEIEAATEGFVGGMLAMVDYVDGYTVDTGGDSLWLGPMQDWCYEGITAAQEFSKASTDGDRSVWYTFDVHGDLPVSQLLDELMDGDTEDNFDEFMSHNPQLIDGVIILDGAQVQIPIAL